MTIFEPDAPALTTVAFLQGMANANASGQLPGLPAGSAPHRTQEVLFLGLDNLISTGGLTLATSVGWRYLLTGRAGEAFTAHVSQPAGTAPALSNLSYGPAITTTLDAANRILNLSALPPGDYTLRVLLIPGIQIEAFWLTPNGGGPAQIVPYLTMSPQLASMTVYPIDQFQALARAIANQVTKHPGRV